MISSDPVAATALHIEPGFEALLRSHGISRLDDLFDDDNLRTHGAHRLDKPGLDAWRSRWRLQLDSGTTDGQTTVYIKRFDHPPVGARREVARSGSGARSLAGVEWNWTHRLMQDGIPCVTPVAIGEQFVGTREVRSVLITREVPGQSLEAWCRTWTPSDRRDWVPLIRPLAHLIRRFHQAGYVHRDLYLSHLFYEARTGRHGTLSPEAFCMIDLQRVRRPTLSVRRLVIKDLASLNYSTPNRLVSNNDRLRWFRHYLGVNRLDAPARRMLYLIVGKTGRIARHDARRNERLGPRSTVR